jgi:Protein of unknown function (DUF2914)
MGKLLGDTTTRIKIFYTNTKKYQPVVAFFSGFTWDSLTLTRIDLLLDNTVMFSYIILAGLFIYIFNRVEEKTIQQAIFLKYKAWYPNIIQFFFGGLFSGYVVYYFQSASITKNWLFILLLIVLLVSNEFIKNRLSNLTFQLGLFYLASFSFFIFYLPVLFETISPFIFILSGIVSSVFVAGLVYLLFKKIETALRPQLRQLIIALATIYLLFNIFYFSNIIPPVPLSLKEAGIYHNIEREGDQYILQFEKGKWYQFFKDSDDIYHYAEGDVIYCFASVFAPTNLDTRIYHHWQTYDEKQQEWLSTDRTNYPISGGRDAGYRGYSNKRNVKPGLWRVNVENEREQVLGRISFEIVATQDTVILQQITK